MLIWDKNINDWVDDKFSDDFNDFDFPKIPKTSSKSKYIKTPSPAPFYIRLSNAPDSSDRTNVDIGNAAGGVVASEVQDGGFVYASQHPNITYSSPIVGMTYGRFLGETIGRPFMVYKTIYQFPDPNIGAQGEEPISIIHNDSNGATKTKVIHPIIHETQRQNFITEIDYIYPFDGLTTLRIANFSGRGANDINLKFYPLQAFVPEFDAYWEWYYSQPFVYKHNH